MASSSTSASQCCISITKYYIKIYDTADIKGSRNWGKYTYSIIYLWNNLLNINLLSLKKKSKEKNSS